VTPLAWIVGSCLAMSAIAWIGALALSVSRRRLDDLLLPLVAFAAGSLLAGAVLHLLPEAIAIGGDSLGTLMPVLAGFGLFFLLEQFLAWHHAHVVDDRAKQPVTHLILLADGLHNFIGGLTIGASFMISPQVGIVTWLAAAAHEVPQELGDFAIMVRGGWPPTRALLANFLSAAVIVPGGLVAYWWSAPGGIAFMLAFAAGNFIYIAASDLIPEVKHEVRPRRSLLHFTALMAGALTIAASRALVGP
jgi:zinc and cadmium transporter